MYLRHQEKLPEQLPVHFPNMEQKVYITARNLDAVKSLAEELKEKNTDVQAAKVDAMNESEIDNFLKKVIAENGKLDTVFNGIGANYGEMGGRPPTTAATFQQFMAPIEKICGSQFHFQSSRKVYDANSI